MMDLFAEEPRNILRHDGEVWYRAEALDAQCGDVWFAALLADEHWSNDVLMMFGKEVTTARQVIWYGDAGLSYRYSGVTKHAIPWSDTMLEILDWVEHVTGERFNSCLLNRYQSGDEGMGWHSDNEPELGEEPVIAALSLGAERRMRFRHISSKETAAIDLVHGSLLVMRGSTQERWQHCIAKTKRINEPRVSLTFRRVVQC
ncbi:alpha-ketoglutarate-dependent dioxygenase AlkB family protein [Rubritalea marina]|uniref:alpha-ketoglutarate-dependent dioxygenase AlkB family protein n=1 Tax=Rubritalea marina TaxID=361055 RepID=UPI00036F4F06|nr:alpha-ketoglutarate-dependent dioxygenase AlkB [Rubritalea marina]